VSGYFTESSGKACHRNRRFPAEIMHAISISENRIEIFSRVNVARPS
jgi:hypothetical protein